MDRQMDGQMVGWMKRERERNRNRDTERQRQREDFSSLQ